MVGVGAPSFEDVVAVARDGAGVELSPDALAAIADSRAVIDALAADVVPHYGVSTGFGALATLHIPLEKRIELQRGLIRSHAAGSGEEVEREVVRALMLLRLSTLATGRTGVRVETAAGYAALLSAGITPVVHEYGSLGCSGDLAPLAHCALALMGEGPVRDAARRRCCPPPTRCAAAGLEPVVLHEKEGLALINGTDGMLGMLVLAIADLRDLLRRRRHRRRDERRGPARHRPRLRRRPARAAPAGRAGRRGVEHARAAGRLADRRLAPRAGGHARAGRLLAALRAAGRGRRARHGRARRDGGRARARVGDRQPGGDGRTAASSPTATSTARRSATCSTSWRSPPPTSPRCPSGAPTASSTWRETTACRRSWPPTRASTRAT